jgi:alginate O-acetyltransferase complex protein AlgI
MLFNSIEFIFVFLPITLAVYAIACRTMPRLGLHALTIASLLFYAAFIPYQTVILLASAVLNFALGLAIRATRRRLFLVLGIAVDLAVLGYFKYAGFASEIAEGLGLGSGYYAVVLPLGLSFHTFQQIAYLVEVWRGETFERNFGRYILFISFFPQLIAGPIVRHEEVASQFGRLGRLRLMDITVGATIFVIGLFKKAVLADSFSPLASKVFGAAAAGQQIGFGDAWLGTLAFTLEIYFDFSAYSDMAIGLARMFSLRFPLNFDSPYKATDISDFWRRWHITLSRFLRDFLYIPLGGNRHGEARTLANLMLVMVLGGLWHGAGWCFLLWGALHGLYLVVYHTWSRLRPTTAWPFQPAAGRALTFIAVAFAWIPFRAEDLGACLRLMASAVGLGGFAAPQLVGGGAILLIALMLLLVWLAPNTQELMGRYRPVLNVRRPWSWLSWRPSLRWAGAMAVLFVWAVNEIVVSAARFIYFQF